MLEAELELAHCSWELHKAAVPRGQPRSSAVRGAAAKPDCSGRETPFNVRTSLGDCCSTCAAPGETYKMQNESHDVPRNPQGEHAAVRKAFRDRNRLATTGGKWLCHSPCNAMKLWNVFFYLTRVLPGWTQASTCSMEMPETPPREPDTAPPPVCGATLNTFSYTSEIGGSAFGARPQKWLRESRRTWKNSVRLATASFDQIYMCRYERHGIGRSLPVVFERATTCPTIKGRRAVLSTRQQCIPAADFEEARYWDSSCPRDRTPAHNCRSWRARVWVRACGKARPRQPAA